MTNLPPGTPRQSGCVDVHEDAVDAGAMPAPATIATIGGVPIRSEDIVSLVDDMGRALEMAYHDDLMERWQRAMGIHPDQIARRRQRAARRVRMARKRRRGLA